MTEGSTTFVPSSAVRSGGSQTPLGPSAIKLNKYGEFSVLLNYSLHSVLYGDELYPTALHLFEARKFLPYRPDLANCVRQCERVELVEQVTSITTGLGNFVRGDWGDVILDVVSKIFPVSHTTSGKRMFLNVGERIDGRGVVPQVSPTHWPAHVAFQHVPCRTYLC